MRIQRLPNNRALLQGTKTSHFVGNGGVQLICPCRCVARTVLCQVVHYVFFAVVYRRPPWRILLFTVSFQSIQSIALSAYSHDGKTLGRFIGVLGPLYFRGHRQGDG